jgi:hypothetical protein
MRRASFAVLAAIPAALLGCSRLPAPGPQSLSGHGLYTGVGLYGPGAQWTRLIANHQTKEPQAARPIDDQVIIVVQNSATGEVRACGDLTGYCIGMNPWRAQLLSSQIAPVKLTEHMAPNAAAAVSVTSAPAETRNPSGAGDRAGHSS